MKIKLGIVTIALIALSITASCSGEQEPRELVLLTNDSFDIGEEIIAKFQEDNNATVVIQKGGSSGAVLTRAILERDNPSADLLYGIDNTYLSRAIDEGVFVKYESPLLDKIPAQLRFDETSHVSPVDYGYVNLNYDKEYLVNHGLDVPNTLEQLTQSQWKGRLVVENPATSSPGLAFLISTISYFGEDDEYDYIDFWKDLKANDLLVKDSWSDAYYTDFSLYGGDRPLVLSYSTSPAAEVFFSEGAHSEPPTGNVLIDKATFLQIEGIGILKGSKNIDLARKFVDFVLDKQFQEDIPSRMFVYPANSQAEQPDFFKFAASPIDTGEVVTSDIGPETINQKREAWIDMWIKAVLR